MAEASGQSLNALARGFNSLPPQRKIGLMVLVAAVIAMIVGAAMWAQAPDYRVLYGNLADRDGGQVIDALQKLNIPFKTGDGGAIMVPATMVYESRLKLASQGLPKGNSSGFELMDNQKFGLTQFQENVNYQRALEGEITRTIETISAVQNARVHLAIPKATVFVREETKPSASVLVNLYGGHALDKAQVAGIVHLVASSVPEMPASNVTIVDQNGKMLSSAGGDKASSIGLDSSQLEYLKEVETGYAKRIEDIISPIVGASNIHAQVTADLDFAQSEQTAESYRPNPTPDAASIRSQQTSENYGDGSANASGVPGALSNQPPGAATAPINTANAKPGAGAAPAAAGTGLSRKDSTINYELDKTISHTKAQVGSVKRLSVAVVVNNKQTKDKKGKVSSQPLTKDELSQVYNLTKEAMGYNEKRGDTLNIVNASFTTEDVGGEATEIPFLKDPMIQSWALILVKYLIIGALMFFLVFGVLKPLAKEMMTTVVSSKEEGEGDGNLSEGAAPGVTAGSVEARAGQVGEVVHIGGPPNYENVLNAVKTLAKDDPKIVANVVKDWVNGE